MRERFSIVITDIHGSKHYNLHQVIKKILMYSILVVLLLLISSVFFISYLNKSVDDLEVKKQKLETVYSKLKLDNKNVNETILQKTQKLELLSAKVKELESLKTIYSQLKTENENINESISQKVEELDSLNTKMNELEVLIGIKPSAQNVSLIERVDLAKVSTAQKKLLFQNIPNGYPIKNEGITGSYGWRQHPIVKKREFHTGIDLRAKRNTKIYAPADGIINFAGFHKKSGYGIMIILDHNYGFRTLYGHMNKAIVKKGDVVRKGDHIGYTGNTGLSSGPHLHYELRYLQTATQPLSFMNWNMKNYETIFKKEKHIKWQSLINLMTNQASQVSMLQVPQSSLQEQESKVK